MFGDEAVGFWFVGGAWGVRFRQWREGGEREGVDDAGRFFMGEVPGDLALVIENGKVEFKIGSMVEKAD